jgi:RNA polymerase sigma factor (sigma-70 family)
MRCVQDEQKKIEIIVRAMWPHRPNVVNPQGFDVDDTIQEVRVTLLEREHHFNPALGSRSTFVGVVTRSTVISMLRMTNADKRGGNIHLERLDQPLRGDDGETTLGELTPGKKPPDGLSAVEYQVHIAEIRTALKVLPPLQQRLCYLLMWGHSKKEIASILGISRGMLHREIRRLRDILTKAGFEVGATKPSEFPDEEPDSPAHVRSASRTESWRAAL